MQRISSKDNSLIKHIKRLKEKKYRDEYGEYVVEGLKLIKEAIQENADIKHIVVCDGCDNSEMIESHLKYEMARLDFSQKYRINDTEDEINELGKSINTMSDKLEETIKQ